MNVGTQASKLPIEQPPHPLDRSSLDLKNPERSSSLEPPRALMRHWSSHRGYPRATATSHSRTRSFRLQNSKKEPPLESFPADLSFGGGRVAIEKTTRLHALISSPESMAHAPIAVAAFEAQIRAFQAPIQESGTTNQPQDLRSISRRQNRPHQSLHVSPRAGEAPASISMCQHVAACARHTRPHARATCRLVVPLRQPLSRSQCATSTRHDSMPRQKKKKKKKEKILGRWNGLLYYPNSSSRPLWHRLEAKFS